MSLLDKLTSPFLGKTADGVVYYRFANRAQALQVKSQRTLAEVRNLILVMYGIVSTMTFGGLAFAGALTLIIAMSETTVALSFDLRWLFLAELGQILLIVIVICVFDGVISRLLRRQP
ncbi:hypothetical protein MMA231_01083 [Asticcacaulis sp. MM231]|uniref:hypothetical protein n=1 Tax=Asticcacaulis sp. MM231 TaxID=3157666 RepID=UPI0032D5B051